MKTYYIVDIAINTGDTKLNRSDICLALVEQNRRDK
jgi:hypothetical protein